MTPDEARALWIPTKAEKAAIRTAGIRTAFGGRKAITLAPRWNIGTRHAVKPPGGEDISLNGYLVAESIDDTDLHDYGRWSDFLKGIPLNLQGRAWVDFYILPAGFCADDCDGLLGNVTVWYEVGRGIVRMECI